MEERQIADEIYKFLQEIQKKYNLDMTEIDHIYMDGRVTTRVVFELPKGDQ